MSDAVWKILQEFGETDRSNVWQVQNATVIKHACLERVAAKAGIVFETPQVLRAERDEAVILVTGRRDTRLEWSIGEALVNVNYRVSGKMAAYVYAMAEKRAKDRVILKLINLHGLAYSEDEADDFKEQAGAPQPRQAQDNAAPASGPSPAERLVREWQQRIATATDHAALYAWWMGDDRKKMASQFGLTQQQIDAVKNPLGERIRMLKSKEAA